MKETNQILHETFMEVVENQIRDDNPPETRKTYDRLISHGISDKAARNYIGEAVCVEVWDIMRNNKEFNLKRFLKNLKRLPNEPKE